MSTIPTRLLPQQVTLQTVQTGGAYGTTYGTPQTVPARVDRTRKLIETSTSVQTISEARIIIQPGTEWPVGSLVTLPGETYSSGKGHPIVQSAPKIGAHGTHHIELAI